MKCPACRREAGLENICPRCGLELTALMELHAKYGHNLRTGINKLKNENFREAYAFFQKAYRMENTEKAQKGLAASLAGMGYYKKAAELLLKNLRKVDGNRAE
ncbi:MAG: hypothetical protein A2096_01100 [Spirochaetes bacterium GWF1_41_5]|nr:MAG: hypothetical protein A2096_01100 [Spirochaetes bacterium GWF1_41_5]HBE03153.1 hypothetical protein [Spirochaetia bacterium]